MTKVYEEKFIGTGREITLPIPVYFDTVFFHEVEEDEKCIACGQGEDKCLCDREEYNE